MRKLRNEDRRELIKQLRQSSLESEYKKRQTRGLLLFVLGVVVITVIAGFLFRQSPPRPLTGRTDIASDFPEGHWFNTLHPLSLYDQLKGHVVVVLFNDFKMLSDLEDLSRFYDMDSVFYDQQVVFLVVTAGRTVDMTESLVAQWQIDFPVLADPDSLAMTTFGIRVVPAILVIDTASRVAARYYDDWQRIPLQAVVRDLLDQGIATGTLAPEKFVPIAGESSE